MEIMWPLKVQHAFEADRVHVQISDKTEYLSDKDIEMCI